jgi:putative acetyltransferase
MGSIRLAQKNDVLKCAEIFYQTVMKLAPALYTPEQVCAWCQSALNNEKFTNYILNPDTFVYCSADGQIRGFSGLESNGHIASLYVDPDFCRQGIATKLLTHIIDYSKVYRVDFLYAEASFLSKNVFLRMGFTVEEIEFVKYNDVDFKRFRVVLKTSPLIT